MKYGGFFVNDFWKSGDKLCLKCAQQIPSRKDFVIVLVDVETKKEILFSQDDVVVSGDMLELTISSYLDVLLSEEGRWEVYLKTEQMMCRFETVMNKGRKRYPNGKKVVPYKTKKSKNPYDMSSQVKDAFGEKTGERSLLPRFTKDGQMMFQSLPTRYIYLYRYFLKVEKLYLEDDKITLVLGKETFGFDVKRIKLYLRGAISREYFLEKVSDSVYQISLQDVDWHPFFWDFFAEVEKDGVEYKFRLRNYKKGFGGSIRKRMGDKYLFSYHTQNDNIILYYRPYSEYDEEKYRRREKLAVLLYRMFKPFWDMRGIVLLYEKFCKCAQDNAYYMFLYYMNKGGRDKRNTYYVIDPREPDVKQLEGYEKNVLKFMSLRHMIYLQAAKLLMSTDSIKHAYQWRGINTPIYDKMVTKKSVFLQHGVMALKKVEYIYRKSGGNKTDLFIASSPIEQKIISEYFRYRKQEIPITGLARWDALEDKQRENVILFMPTWRNWIMEVGTDQFLQTEYYQTYMNLLGAKRLETMLKEHNTKMVFCMHPKFREFIGEFKTAGEHIQLFDYSSKPINQQIMEASMMVTDYSSVSWDMYYLGKPVVFYQFDYERYMECQGSYIDMTTDLFGDRVLTSDELMEQLEYYMSNGFEEKKIYADMRDELLPYRDGKHCKRIDQAIQNRLFAEES